jgi:hypothetical protein
MNKLLFSLILLLTITAVWAQAPQRMSYQSVIRDGNNVVVASTAVGIKISVVRGTATGTAVYVETHRKTTNANGLVSLEIGEGTSLTGRFADIDWSNGPYLIKTETDPTGGTNYSIPGIAALNSVPYALFSANGTPGPQGERGLTGATGATGPAGATGPQGARGLTGATGAIGPQGERGLSGAVGATGPAGATGPTGPTGAQGERGLTGAAGLAGPTGTNGTNGANGLDGKTVLNGTSNPTSEGADGDFYINTTSNMIFGPKASGAWPNSGVSLVGPTGTAGTNGTNGFPGAAGINGINGVNGAPGANGLDGKTVLNGTSNPTSEGADGDFYINTTSNMIFGPKASGVWPNSGVSLVGPTGTAGTNGTNGLPGAAGINGVNGAPGANGLDGKTVLNGTSNPTSEGADGDFYINTTSNMIFGPKASGAWPNSGVSLIGIASMGSISGTSTANGATITSGELNLAPADGTNGGIVTTGAQTFAGAKTFGSDMTVNAITIGRGAGNIDDNTAIGSQALLSNTTGNKNTATGYQALYRNSTGEFNVAVGYNALRANNGTSGNGSRNTAVGNEALLDNTTGFQNVATGHQALYRNTTGGQNTAIGSFVLYNNTSGNNNVAIGPETSYSNTTGSQNTAIGGYGALRANTTGSGNTALGFYAHNSNISGSNNTAIGGNSGSYLADGSTPNTISDYSLYLGYNTKASADNTQNEIVIGYNAIGSGSNTVQLGNTSITNVKTSGTITAGTVTYPKIHGTSGEVLTTNGSGELTWASAGGGNLVPYNGATSAVDLGAFNLTVNGISVGRGAGNNDESVAVGSGAMGSSNVNGKRNTAVGAGAMRNYIGTSWDNNTSMGYSNMPALTTGSGNTSIGAESMMALTTGTENTSVGNQSLINTTGNNNVGLGKRSGQSITSGNQNTIVGTDADVSSATLSNSTALGYGAVVNASDKIQLGNASVTNVATAGTITAGTVTYPNTFGTANQVLTTDGAGTASWAPPTFSSNKTVLSTVTIEWSALNNYDVSNVSIIFVKPNSSWTDIYGLQGGVLGQVIHIYTVNNQTSNCCTGLSLINFDAVGNTGTQKFVAGGGVNIDSNRNTMLVFDGTYWRVTSTM